MVFFVVVDAVASVAGDARVFGAGQGCRAAATAGGACCGRCVRGGIVGDFFIDGAVWRRMRWIVEQQVFVRRRQVGRGDEQNGEQRRSRHSRKQQASKPAQWLVDGHT